MTLDSKRTETLKAADSKFLGIIDKFGWHVMSVAPLMGDDGILFSYSTGLFYRFQHPEILLCGLDTNIARLIINEIGGQVREGAVFHDEKEYAAVFGGGVKCQFRPVLTSYYREYVGWSQWFYEYAEFPLLQCFWPDKHGLFPWEEGCNSEVAALQPQLFRLPSDVM